VPRDRCGPRGPTCRNVTVLGEPLSSVRLNGGGSSVNTACFTASQFASGSAVTGFGTIPRNSFRGPGYFNTDFGPKKTFRLNKRFGLTLGANAYNVLNHVNFANPVSNLASTSNFRADRKRRPPDLSIRCVCRGGHRRPHRAGVGSDHVLAALRERNIQRGSLAAASFLLLPRPTALKNPSACGLSCDHALQKRALVKKGGFAEEFERRFANHLRDQPWFRPGLKIGAGVSGGADSIALLRLLASLRPQLGIVLSVVHFNHQLRGKASDTDERFVAALAEQLGLTLHIGRGNVGERAERERVNLEDAARRARYAHFHKLSEQGIVEVVLTAHTMDDQAETVLAHILRGTGLFGLAGIHPAAGPVRRPLLNFRREELRQYLRHKRQRWREDASNRDCGRTRARMRRTLLPLLTKRFNPAAVEHLAGLATRALEEAAVLDALSAQLVEKLVSFGPCGAQIGVRELLDPLGMPDPDSLSGLRSRLVRAIVERAKKRHGQLSSGHVEAIVRFARQGETGKRLQIPGGLDVLRERQTLLFRERR